MLDIVKFISLKDIILQQLIELIATCLHKLSKAVADVNKNK